MNNLSNHPTISVDEIIRPTRVEVNLKLIRENYHRVKEHIGPIKMMPILKANAYGHGLIKIAQVYQEMNVDYLGVAVVEEGILLREYGINVPILVLGGTWENQIPLFLKNDLIITASSIVKLRQIEEAAKLLRVKAKVHLIIDTGMERTGVHYFNAEKFITEAYRLKSISVDGIYSHFASSDSTDLTYTKLQFERFMEVLYFFEKHSLAPPLRHISNSGAVLQFPEANLDMVRPGILLYGVYPSQSTKKTIQVNPVLTWKSLVVYFKVITPGHPVGYGMRWKSDHNVRAVTVPVGYGDGYFRSMSGKARVIIRGNKYPVIGTISMDQVVVNIEQDSAYHGDEVILLGKDGNSSITAEELADWAATIPYEILTNINTRVPRIYIE